MSNDITIGKAYFNNNEGMHLFRYSEKETDKEIQRYTLRTKNSFVIASFESLLRLKEHFNTHVLFVHSVFNNLFALNSSKNLLLQNNFLNKGIIKW